MRIAIIADIHGNLLALEAVLADLERQRIDRLIVAGDMVIGSPDSAACWERIKALHVPVVRGNHERYLVEYCTDGDASLNSRQFAPVAYAAAQFNPLEKAAIAELPQSYRPSEAPDVLVVHASLRSDRDIIVRSTGPDELAAQFPAPANLIIRAHQHIPAERRWVGRRIVTAGSVGLSLGGDTRPHYLIAEQRRSGWRISQRSVGYDHVAALARFVQTGYLDVAGPIARLYQEELRIAQPLIIPFLRDYERWKQSEPLAIDRACERWLAKYLCD
ncbi:MAG: metallophosphoesterase family protein [Oscillochloris sp.]|nr:metallophosphoesterase family protein [Oscillochloris sp.]